jgi:FHA domain-containing protein
VDEKRAVSRIHGQITFRNGQYLIDDQGTNPLKVNGVPLGKGNTAQIKTGDRIIIGPYELEVRGGGSAPGRPDSGDLAWGAPPSSAPMHAGSGAPVSGNPFDDLFAPASASAPGGLPEEASSDALFADLGFGGPASSPPPPARPAARPPAASTGNPFGPGSLPDDFDPMAAPAPEPSSAPLGADFDDDAFSGLLGSSPKAPGEGSLDQMFGLSSGSAPYNDPFASGPLGKPAPSHSGGTDSGLTRWIGGFDKSAPAPVADKVPELNSAFTPPRAVTPTAAPLPDAQMLDLDAFGPAPTPRPAAAPPPPQVPARPAPPARPAAAPPPPMAAPRPRAATGGPAAPPSDLLQALLSGMNAPELQIDDLSPELMYKLGSLMNEAVAGTIALLNARGSVKREMRADVTMIASGRNNPLKFSPDAGLALRYMFGASMPGFMEAEEAMRDAYSDLRAHEFGFMAGLRAALSAVLKRFEPGALEARLPEKGGINALVPMNRKAKLWELFSELYRQIATEAEEDFHNLFGREFLRAYEEHIAALERSQKRRQ